MSDDNKDLLRFANEYADQNVDLYDLLGVDALTSKEDIHRAWRKRSLKHHPDKAGDKFDASKWELFERARDVLSDPSARAAYDQASKAKLLRKQEREAMDKERKKFADDLEAREGAAMHLRQEKEQRDREALQRERERLAEEQRMRNEEQRRQAEAAQEMEDLAEARRRLKEKRDEKARKRQAKESIKASMGVGKPAGPDNGGVNVPGDYMANLGGVNKRYWELVCDKLRAVQAVRDLQKQAVTTAEELQRAEEGVQEARRRIHEAEVKYQREAAAF
ncbi:Pre-mRNA-splicing factor cwf23 [Tolypocladium capitatum]|uniref:Pre-mRNA-splicing factor cwf23 n=1 Tax=Tolypocladium capitatum TaxID=45235 RepID=A0A2K3QK62_9HYPO|nr:Pre-mRNA-splicing factor cwf23 [Tolypocladium capitatum]